MSDDEKPMTRGEQETFLEQWRPLFAELPHITVELHVDQEQAAELEQLRAQLDRRQRKELYDQVIERYNRAHGQKKKITLADVCAEMGVSYEAVRKYRQRTPKHKNKK